jgi:hypothetical protein
LGTVRRDFRGKEPVKVLVKAHQSFSTPYSACLSSDNAGSKRTQESPGGESRSAQKKQAPGTFSGSHRPAQERADGQRAVRRHPHEGGGGRGSGSGTPSSCSGTAGCRGCR